jgi:hypothetical protein
MKLPQGMHSVTPHLVCAGALEDPFGHHWSVATHVRDVSMEEAQMAMHQMEKS